MTSFLRPSGGFIPPIGVTVTRSPTDQSVVIDLNTTDRPGPTTTTAACSVGFVDYLNSITLKTKEFAFRVKDHLSGLDYTLQVVPKSEYTGMTKVPGGIYLLTDRAPLNWPPTVATARRTPAYNVSVTPCNASLPSSGGSYFINVDIDNTSDWAVTVPTGVTVDILKGRGPGRIYVTVAANTSTVSITKAITIAFGTVSVTHSILIQGTIPVYVDYGHVPASKLFTDTSLASLDSTLIQTSSVNTGTPLFMLSTGTVRTSQLGEIVAAKRVANMNALIPEGRAGYKFWNRLQHREDGVAGISCADDKGLGLRIHVLTKAQYNAIPAPRPKTDLYFIVDDTATDLIPYITTRYAPTYLGMSDTKLVFSPGQLVKCFYLETGPNTQWRFNTTGFPGTITPNTGTGRRFITVEVPDDAELPDSTTVIETETVCSGVWTDSHKDITMVYIADPDQQIILDKEEIVFDYYGQSAGSAQYTANAKVAYQYVTVDVPTGERWTISAMPAWVLPTGILDYTNARSISFQVTKHTGALDRTGAIIFELEGNSMITTSLTITQRAHPGLVVYPDTFLTAAPIAESHTINIETRADLTGWVLDGAPPSWVTLGKNTGTARLDSTTIAFTDIGSNNTRSAAIVFKAIADASVMKTVTITQYGRAISAAYAPSSTVSVTSANGRTDVIGITTQESTLAWQEYSTKPAWISTTASGIGSLASNINIAANTTFVSRSHTLLYRLTNYPTKTTSVLVSQGAAAYTLSTSPTSLSFSAAGESKNTAITTNSTYPWSAVATGTGFSITGATSGTTNGVATIRCTANPTYAIREGYITFTYGGGGQLVVPLTQAAAVATIAISPSDWQIPFQYGEQSFTITTAATSWTLTKPAWVTLTTTSGTFNPSTLVGSGTATILATVTFSGTARTGTMVATAPTGSYTTTLSQAGGSAGISFSPTTWAAPAIGGTRTITVTSSSNWTFAARPTGISTSVAGGAPGQTVVTLTATANNTLDAAASRQVTATVGGVTAATTITQDSTPGISIVSTASGGIYAANSTSGTFTLKVFPDIEAWTLVVDNNWLTLDAAAGTGDATLTGTWASNSTVNPRTNRITATDADANINYVDIEQLGVAEAATLNFESINVTATGTTYTKYVTSNCAIDIMCSGTSMSVSPTSHAAGTDIPITITTSDNNTDGMQVETVSVLKSGTQTLLTSGIIYQDATSISLSASTAAVVAGGASPTVNITVAPAGAAWTATSDSAWCTIDTDGTPLTKSGTGSTTGFGLTVAANTGASRSATVTFTRITGVTTAIVVTQAAFVEAASCTPTTKTFVSTAGTGTISMTSNVGWTAASTNAELSVSPLSGVAGTHTLTITRSENTSTTTDRTGTINITATVGGAQLASCGLTQSKTLTASVSPESLAFIGIGETINIAVTANGAWTAGVSGTGFTITSGDSGTGDGTIAVNATTNGESIRTGTVTLSYGLDQTIDIGLSQEAYTTYTMVITPSSWAPDADTHSQVIAITPSGTSQPTRWTLASNQAWLTLAATGSQGRQPGDGLATDETITSYCSKNTTASTRTGTLTAVFGGVTKTRTVTQAAASYEFSISPASWSPTADAANGTLGITPSGTGQPVMWAASSNAGWLTFAGTGGQGHPPSELANSETITMYAAKNYTDSTRTGTITVSFGSVTHTRSVTQAAADYTLAGNPTSISPTKAGGTTQVGITMSGTGTPLSYAISSNAAWLTIAALGAQGHPASELAYNEAIDVTAAANPDTGTRTGTLTLAAGSKTASITVTQAVGDALVINPTASQAFVPDGEDIPFTVTAIGPWTAGVTGTGFSIVSGGTGSGNGTVTVRAAANTSTSNITNGSLTVTADGTSNADSCTLTQDKITLTSVSPTSWSNITNAGTTQSITVTADGQWEVSAHPTWISHGAGGTGNGSCTLTATANTGAARSDTVTFRMVNDTAHTASVTVAQLAAASGGFAVKMYDGNGDPCTTITVPDTAMAPDTDRAIYWDLYNSDPSNAAWTAHSDSAWLRINGATSDASGTGDTSQWTNWMNVDNNTSTQRVGTITFTQTSSQIQHTLTVTQSAADLSYFAILSATSLGVPAGAPGLAAACLVSSGDWTASDDKAWLGSVTSGTAGLTSLEFSGDGTGVIEDVATWTATQATTARTVTVEVTVGATVSAGDGVYQYGTAYYAYPGSAYANWPYTGFAKAVPAGSGPEVVVGGTTYHVNSIGIDPSASYPPVFSEDGFTWIEFPDGGPTLVWGVSGYGGSY